MIQPWGIQRIQDTQEFRDEEKGSERRRRFPKNQRVISGSRGCPDFFLAAEEPPPEGLWSVAKLSLKWTRRMQGTESRYYHTIGPAEALMLKAADLGQRWMKSVSGDFALKKLREQPIPW